MGGPNKLKVSVYPAFITYLGFASRAQGWKQGKIDAICSSDNFFFYLQRVTTSSVSMIKSNRARSGCAPLSVVTTEWNTLQ